MLTYPSTHGVFEEAIGEICAAVHDAGGQVYVDGANLNALVGLAQPGRFGADVSHLNLHKTFCIPHGGGGPGVGPVGGARAPRPVPARPPARRSTAGRSARCRRRRSARPGILPIPWAYIALMGADGLRHATAVAILLGQLRGDPARRALPGAVHRRRGPRRPRVHRRPARRSPGRPASRVDDVAKRLMDYGFHAPTMSFPVAGHVDDRADRERDAGRARPLLRRDDRHPRRDRPGRRREWPLETSPLRLRPAHRRGAASATWDRPTTASSAPTRCRRCGRPSTSRRSRAIDAAAGDRNLVCSCEPLEAYATSPARSPAPDRD